jgi:hypothetical protein
MLVTTTPGIEGRTVTESEQLSNCRSFSLEGRVASGNDRRRTRTKPTRRIG